MKIDLHLGQFMAKPFLIEKAPVFSGLLFIAGLAVTLIGIASLLSPDLIEMGGVEFIVLIVGILFLLIGLVWIMSFQSTVRKFDNMLSENRKATFVKNLDEIEYLAWKLPMRYEEELEEKKRKLGIR
ncbi:MAG TPA: DUF3198 domain-containing protein [Methanomassiliicoccales archaeon]|nr:DUF3198 domain-containing protein [Methanomassiliicoccales archaeon]